MTDGYHLNWYTDDADNRVTLTDEDIDNLANVGPVGYSQTNGIIAQQYDNRLTASGDGLGTVDPTAGTPTWSPSGYTGNTVPELPNVDLEASAPLWTTEDDVKDAPGTLISIQVNFGEPSQSVIRLYYTFTIPGGLGITGEVVDQVDWPNPLTWSAAPGPFVDVQPVGGRSGGTGTFPGTQADSPQSGPQFPFVEGFFSGSYDKYFFRVVAAAGPAYTTGTKVVTFELSNGADQPEIEYPTGSGTFVDTGHAGPQSVTTNIIPAVDYAEAYAIVPSISVSLSNPPPNDLVQFQVVRDPVANADADEVQSVLPFIDSQVGAGTVTAPSAIGFPPNDNIRAVTLVINSSSGWVVGDSFTLTFDYATATALQAPTGGGKFTSVTITFDA